MSFELNLPCNLIEKKNQASNTDERRISNEPNPKVTQRSDIILFSIPRRTTRTAHQSRHHGCQKVLVVGFEQMATVSPRK